MKKEKLEQFIKQYLQFINSFKRVATPILKTKFFICCIYTKSIFDYFIILYYNILIILILTA